MGALCFDELVSLSIKAPEDCWEEADGFVGHLPFAGVAVVFVWALVMVGIAKGWARNEGGIVTALGWRPSAVRLPMHHGVIRDSEGPGRNGSYD
jgi:hypothetical protein